MNSLVKKYPVAILPAVLLCIATGLIFFGGQVFDIRTPMFQFVAYALIGAVSFAFFRERHYQQGMLLSVLVFLVLFFIGGSRFPVTQLVYFVCVVGSTGIPSLGSSPGFGRAACHILCFCYACAGFDLF